MEFDSSFFKELKERYVRFGKEYSDIPMQTDSDNLIVKYGKSPDTFKNSLLRHIDEGKCQYKKLLNKLKDNLVQRDYTQFYFNEKNELIKSVFGMPDGYSFDTYYISKDNMKIQAEYRVDSRSQTLGCFEIARYDDFGNIISCEKFQRQFKSPYGAEIDGEYYFYDSDNKNMISAYKIKDFNLIYEPFYSPFLKFYSEFYGDAEEKTIVNPEIYLYQFIYDASGIATQCEVTHKVSQSKATQNILDIDCKELKKLSSYGVKCFGIVE